MSTIDPASTTTTPTTTSGSNSSQGSNPGLGINETQFLQLMVTQLQYQDPLDPSDPSDFVTQLAQMTSVEQETNTATNTQTSELLSLLGQTVTYTDSAGNVDEGQVSQVDLGTNGATLTVGGVSGISSSQITGVVSASSSDSSSSTGTGTS